LYIKHFKTRFPRGQMNFHKATNLSDFSFCKLKTTQIGFSEKPELIKGEVRSNNLHRSNCIKYGLLHNILPTRLMHTKPAKSKLENFTLYRWTRCPITATKFGLNVDT
jgi:hypothetical protein